ncbi:MAG: hypothetical protein ACI9X0_003005, partial [Kiritimatiellia bacterium]
MFHRSKASVLHLDQTTHDRLKIQISQNSPVRHVIVVSAITFHITGV